ncbi:MAG: sugar transferase [Planctomycetota bacterium]|nr:sugar transferase [Planctomycetota bacterium]
MLTTTTAVRRLLDLLGAILGIGILLPLMPWIVLALLFENAGPILVRLPRVGAVGRSARFRQFRFRVTGIRGRWLGCPTPVGKALPRLRLDGMPQLLNVLLGQMSLVGPRAIEPSRMTNLLENASPGVARLLAMPHVRPGVFGPAQRRPRRCDSLHEVLCDRVLFDLPRAGRWSDRGLGRDSKANLADEVSGIFQDLRAFLSHVTRRDPIGNEAIRLELPHHFDHLKMKPSDLASASPDGLGAEAQQTSTGYRAWWYPRRAGRLDVPERGRFDMELLRVAADEVRPLGEGGVEVVRYLGSESEKENESPFNKSSDTVVVEFPSGLHEVDGVAHHLQPLWQELAHRTGNQHLAGDLSILFLQSTAVAADMSPTGRERIHVEVAISADAVALQASWSGAPMGRDLSDSGIRRQPEGVLPTI